ncbi:MAG: molybdopterin molybdenumtransferase MoeA, partial [Acidobacteriaceae bacterium]|nr:molybdopterin molybdenumtransferase MoeA [Acidobacteriaceae bacterium]
MEFGEARRIVIDIVRASAKEPATETVPLDAAYGRVLAEEITADRNYPAVRRSLRDGFAVRAADVPGILRVRGEVRAGEG